MRAAVCAETADAIAAMRMAIAPAYSDSLHGELQRRIAAYLEEFSAKSNALYP